MDGRARVYEGRDRLPAPKPLGRGFSIWSILKNMIGRDLTKITMPATINEPTSMTQRMAEVLENCSLLEKAAGTPNRRPGPAYAGVVLAAGGLQSQPQRDNKPFNPLLGETFEWVAPDGTARYLCEQVLQGAAGGAAEVEAAVRSQGGSSGGVTGTCTSTGTGNGTNSSSSGGGTTNSSSGGGTGGGGGGGALHHPLLPHLVHWPVRHSVPSSTARRS
ncbi:hypothetical protein HYH02_011334 [Chlamydomonas schloesseri]|uniref:Uncharacterized protein n=1 Tax=Chlamydomonas schloesseri TaxID=2026947 RepID=A0A835TFY6_9CHLO|nr:hypothetical protein HYH02_011334 [Chlamydomonas schloesseri]|eukprot:KAG2437075.1 hypothetical protein HYH02_011334 [Chlamydomonas schloesseri]